MHGRPAAVYDVTVAFTLHGSAARPPAPSLADTMTRRYGAVHVHVARFPLASLPADPAALGLWLVGRFKEKDRLLSAFYAGEGFPGPAWRTPYPLAAAAPRALLWGALLALSWGTAAGRRLYFGAWLLAGVGGVAVMAAGRAR